MRMPLAPESSTGYGFADEHLHGERRAAASCACSKRSLNSISVMTPLSMSTLTSTAQTPMWPA
jgi:hypothetical protein